MKPNYEIGEEIVVTGTGYRWLIKNISQGAYHLAPKDGHVKFRQFEITIIDRLTMSARIVDSPVYRSLVERS